MQQRFTHTTGNVLPFLPLFLHLRSIPCRHVLIGKSHESESSMEIQWRAELHNRQPHQLLQLALGASFRHRERGCDAQHCQPTKNKPAEHRRNFTALANTRPETRLRERTLTSSDRSQLFCAAPPPHVSEQKN